MYRTCRMIAVIGEAKVVRVRDLQVVTATHLTVVVRGFMDSREVTDDPLLAMGEAKFISKYGRGFLARKDWRR
jgi:hypothetical protein